MKSRIRRWFWRLMVSLLGHGHVFRGAWFCTLWTTACHRLDDANRGYRVPADSIQLNYEEAVRCVVMDCCGFTFSAEHTDTLRTYNDPPTYTCPGCHPHS